MGCRSTERARFHPMKGLYLTPMHCISKCVYLLTCALVKVHAKENIQIEGTFILLHLEIIVLSMIL